MINTLHYTFVKDIDIARLKAKDEDIVENTEESEEDGFFTKLLKKLVSGLITGIVGVTIILGIGFAASFIYGLFTSDDDEPASNSQTIPAVSETKPEPQKPAIYAYKVKVKNLTESEKSRQNKRPLS